MGAFMEFHCLYQHHFIVKLVQFILEQKELL